MSFLMDEGENEEVMDEAEVEEEEEMDTVGELVSQQGRKSSVSQRSVVVVRNENPFFFWLSFMAVVSIITVVFVTGKSILNRSENIEILSMPAGVRAHFEAGRLVKVEVGRDRNPVKLFVRASGEGETVLLLHGLGSSSYSYRKLVSLLSSQKLSAIAVDLPGAGLSEKSHLAIEEEEEEDQHHQGFFHDRLEALKALLVEGFFHTGNDESSEHEFLANLRSVREESKARKVLALAPDELAEALDQIVASLELAPVHLVMHDTGVEVGLAWASQNPFKVASLTLVDTVPRSPSLPFWLFKVPVLGPFIAYSDLAFRLVLRSCCFASVTADEAEDHDYLFRSGEGLRASMASLAASNTSMDVAEWASLSHLNHIPKQILWASGWSNEWQREGEQLAGALPGASFHSHHGSRWPQEDAAPEIAELITEFVKSLSSSELLYEVAKDVGNPRFSSNVGRDHRHHHNHEQKGLGYMEGLGQAAGVGHGGWVV